MSEWLQADGLGGYAMGTADGIRTRRYHALLVAATRAPEGRMALVADLEVTAETAAGRFALSSHRYRGGVVWPDGAARIAAFAAVPWPRWEYALADGTRLAFELWITPGAPRVTLRWRRLAGSGPLRLVVRPLLSGRDHHALHHENGAFRFDAERDGAARVTWRPYPGVPAIVAQTSGGSTYRHEPDWYRAFHYACEAERGLECDEDLASPGVFDFDLDLGLAGGDATLAFAADGVGLDDLAPPRSRAVASDAYLVARGAGRTIIAGYPWFTDWGRDTFISLRGLCLASGRLDDARAIVHAWCPLLSEGMLPNHFPEAGGAPAYNTVDAALWFAIAADALCATGACAPDEQRAIERTIDAIVAGYAAGTRHGIRADADGLLACGEPGVQLTWMDAKIGHHVITPRIGKPVEIQALWANALAIAGRRDPRWLALLERARAAFAARFWNAGRAMLHDVVDCDHVAGVVDASLRPNQIFAIGGLPLALVDPASDRARAIVDVVERALWTPAGLRSLAPGEPGYRGGYGGGIHDRDGAYHQGTAWPWLAGAFVEAWVRVRGDTAAARTEARARFLAPLLAHCDPGGTGHLPEIADGNPPHALRGAPFQAWSVGEALRLAALLR